MLRYSLAEGAKCMGVPSCWNPTVSAIPASVTYSVSEIPNVFIYDSIHRPTENSKHGVSPSAILG
jgi:hypothetical protein